jgi:hypothetical protein
LKRCRNRPQYLLRRDKFTNQMRYIMLCKPQISPFPCLQFPHWRTCILREPASAETELIPFDGRLHQHKHRPWAPETVIASILIQILQHYPRASLIASILIHPCGRRRYGLWCFNFSFESILDVVFSLSLVLQFAAAGMNVPPPLRSIVLARMKYLWPERCLEAVIAKY